MRSRSRSVPRSTAEKSPSRRESFATSRGRNVSVCTQLGRWQPTRRFRISCKGKPAENRGVPVVCRPTHPKAVVAMTQEREWQGNRGMGRKRQGIDLRPINRANEWGAQLCANRHKGESRRHKVDGRRDAVERGGRVGVTGWKWHGGIDELRDNTLCCSWGKGAWRRPVRECTIC